MKRKAEKTIALIGGALLLKELSQYAFSKGVNRYMFRRDQGICQESGVKASDGFLLHAAHYPRKHLAPDWKAYNRPENGRMIWAYEHAREHIEMFLAASENGSQDWYDFCFNALCKIAKTTHEEGVMKRNYYNQYPKHFERDQLALDNLFDKYGLERDAFIEIGYEILA